MHPNNWVFPEYKLAWFGVPKTASSSQKKAVAIGLGVVTPEEAPKYKLGLANSRMTFWDKHRIAEAHKDPEWMSFVMVRNPFDRFVSLWNERIRGRERGTWHKKLPAGLSAEEFAEWLSEHGDDEIDHHARSQTSLIAIDGRLIPTHVMRFEQMGRSWKRCQRAVEERTGIVIPKLPHLRPGKRRRGYREELSKRCRRLLERRYAQDFKLLGYEW